MNKLEKLYFAALKKSTKTHQRISTDIGLQSKIGNQDIREAIMRRSKEDAQSQLKESRKRAGMIAWAARPKSGCSKEFLNGYLEAALWSSTDESNESGGEPLDRNYDLDSFTREALRKAKKDCDDFVDANREDLNATIANDAQNGHDFWLTREGHGAGFWDRGYEKNVGKRLTDAARVYGEGNIHVSRGRVHFG